MPACVLAGARLRAGFVRCLSETGRARTDGLHSGMERTKLLPASPKHRRHAAVVDLYGLNNMGILLDLMVMKTTVEISDSLLARGRKLAREQNVTLGSLTEEGL